MTRQDVLEFEKAIGLRIEDLLNMIDHRALQGLPVDKVRQMIGPDLADMFDIFRQLLKIK